MDLSGTAICFGSRAATVEMAPVLLVLPSSGDAEGSMAGVGCDLALLGVLEQVTAASTSLSGVCRDDFTIVLSGTQDTCVGALPVSGE